MSTTPATSEFNEERQLDVSVGTLKRLKMYAYRHYNQAVKDGAYSLASYWDGYIRACTHVIEAENE
jgi:hypothetical protein